MRIDNSNLGEASRTAAAAETKPTADRQRASEAAKTEGADVSDVSALATKLTASDEQRIERLRKAVQDGSYHVSASEVASRLIDDALKHD